jgi:hypothetical protein
MKPLPPPPAGSCFEVDEDDLGRPRLSWLPPPASILARGFPALFLLFWLCMWAVGEVAAATMLATMIANLFAAQPGPIDFFAMIFISAWLAFWTFGGIAAMAALWALIRPPRPERLTFGEGELAYDPGTSSASEVNTGRRGAVKTIALAELGKIKLVRLEGQQRLSIDHGADRIEIGPSLREPEREWLADVLRRWAGRPEPLDQEDDEPEEDAE